MIFLRRVELTGTVDRAHYPFALPALQDFEHVDFTAPVTFLVGENGSGKSTFIEALALRAKLPPATGLPLEHDPTLAPVHPLALAFRLGWNPRTKFGFFLRAEDFFNFARETNNRVETMEAMAARFDDDPRVRGYMFAQKQAITDRYGDDLHALSHGEAFLKFFQTRCVAGGLHLIDEPEAALSPQRQLAFLSLLKQLVAAEGQFIIATHSPILLAFPDAQILSFDDGAIRKVRYEDLPHVTITRSFLNDPGAYLRQL